ncbi:hypothetical protein [Arthrobacter sp. K5]|jgi:hypothetical protein|uniref:Uncharacterized protein n=1 Tax=Arthrobacter sp. K5 TaxID=2839623 RepID=A0AAU8ENT3_9MICC
MLNPFFLDKSDPGSWKALNGVALKVAGSAEAAGLGRTVVDLLNVRVSILSGHPVRPRPAAGNVPEDRVPVHSASAG